MFGLCKYKDMFGKPNEGLHAYKVCGIAIVDVLATLITAWFINSSFASSYDYYQVAAALFILGIILHRVLCVRTTIDKLLFDE